ncbi:MAG: MSCRAMM family protein [Thermomicrobiales bacterium]
MRAPYRPIRSHFSVPARSRQRAHTHPSGGRAGHALAAFFLLISLLAPLTLAMPAAAAPQPGPQRDLSANARRDGAPPPLPTPFQIVVSGDFGTIDLSDNDGDGTWDGFFQLPPGSYDYRIVHVSDEQRSLGEDGDPDGDDLEVDVPDDALAVYFAYNSLTGEIAGNPLANDVQLQTDLGAFQMAPTDDGDYEVYFDHPGGPINIQVIIDGQPGGADVLESDTGGRAHVVADDGGNLTDAEVEQPATLTVQKTDEGDNPQPGSCFALYDGNDVLSQDCDFNDGSNDGTTVLRFPNGAPGSGDLAETFTPDGVPEAEDEGVDVGPGDNVVQVIVAGGVIQVQEEPEEEEPVEEPTEEEPVEEPIEEPEEPVEEPIEEEPEQQFGSLIAFTTDEDGNLIGGVCYEVSGFGQLCDDVGDGDLTLLDIPTGDYTVTVVSVPDGFELPAEQTDEVTVESGAEAVVNFVAAQSAPETGSLLIAIQSEDGFALLGACVTIAGPQGGSLCDNDQFDADPSDGSILISDIQAGDYQVTLDSAPEGFEAAQASSESATVEPGGQAQVTLLVPAAAPPTNDLLITVRDQNGDRVGGSCIQLDGPQSYGPICDNDENDANDSDGRIRFSAVQLGDYTATMIQPPPGFEQPGSLPLTVAEGETAQLTFDVVGTTGALIATTTDPDGNPIPNVCYDISGLGQQCDDDADGDVTLTDLLAGDYTVTQVSVPEGLDLAAEPSQTVTVASGETAQARFTSEPSAPETGSLQIAIQDDEGQLVGGVCVDIDGPQSGTLCDNDEGDQNPDDGVIEIQNLEPGDFQVDVDSAPEEFDAEAAEGQGATVEAGAQADVTLTLPTAAPPIGILRAITVDQDGNRVPAVCFEVTNFGEICDQDGNGDMTLTEAPVGDYTVTQTQVPDGYALAEEPTQEASVSEDATTEITFIVELLPGTIVISKTDGENPLGGACFTVDGGAEVCDNGEGDASGDEGVIVIENATAGERTIAETRTPDGYQGAADQTVTVPAGGTVDVTFENALEQGGVVIEVTDDETGERVGGACVLLDGPETVEVCDNGDGDANSDDGLIEVQNLTPGDYTATFTALPDGFDDPGTLPITVGAGETPDLPLPLLPLPEPTEEPTRTPEPTETPTEEPTRTPEPTETPTEEATEEASPTEEPTEEATEEATPTEEPATPTSEPTEEPALGQVVITKTNQDGDPLGGACFALSGPSEIGPICDNQGGDQSGDEGTILIPDVPAGDYVVTETQAPEGFSAGPPQEITVAEGETATVTFENVETPPAIGSVRIVSTGPDDAPAGGGTYEVDGVEVTDNGAGDGDAAPGVIQIDGLQVGQYDVTETAAPPGFLGAGPQPVEVSEGETAEVSFAHEPTPPETGGIELQMQDPDGNPVEGACVTLISGELDSPQEICDGGSEDLDPAPGVLVVENLPVGVYSIQQSEPAADAAVAARTFGFQANQILVPAPPFAEKTVTVQANVIIIVIIIIIIQPDDEGDLIIIKRAADTNQLIGGACFRVTGQGDDVEICDNDGNDGHGSVGIIRFDDLAIGLHTLTETTPPPGYQAVADQDVEVDAGATVIEIDNEPTPETEGDLIVNKVDVNGDPLQNSCFELRQGNTLIAGPVCDVDDGNDGVVTFPDVETGNFTLRETQAPSSDYFLAPDQAVQIVAGTETEVDVVNVLKPGRVQIRKEDTEDNLLGGSCFLLDGEDDADYEVCDNEAGDQNPAAGVIRFINIPAGDFTLVETVPPAGYLAADDQPITVEPNQTLFLTVINEEEPPPAQFGDLVIEKVDQDGDPLAGACFVLKQGAVTKVPQVCDNADGANDGTITFADVGVGQYLIVETKKPSNDYQTVAPVDATIQANQTTTIEIENQLKPGRVLVIKRNQHGQPLQNACFDLAPDGQSPKCSNANGQIIYDNLDPTIIYRLRETQAPPGYAQAPNRENIIVKPGLTTTIIIVNKPAPPPPNTGAIRVIKFYCSAGTGEERTEIFDSSNPGAGKLAKTAGCDRGNARFTLDPQAGGNTLTFTTGEDGEYQATLGQGIYLLTETDPVLAGGDRTESVRIFTNQQTTVVVINFLKPPAPAPGTINVVKYTCAPGFAGEYYADFIANCGDQSSLTNNVTFRISGAKAGKHVTGDIGQTGRTRFTQLIAGTYTLKEEPPSTAVSTFAFCGLDANNPTLKAVGTNITFGLKAGQTITCTWFNVPDDVSDTTGAILIYKYVCDANNYPSNFDWYEECSVEIDGTKFTLSRWAGERYTPQSTGVTDANGLLRFSQLRPGAYQLKEIGADWCHAESDSVDKKGDVIVRAGFRSTVWIFNCVETKAPPNTGAGTTAGMPAPAAAMVVPEEAAANSTLLLSLAWPVLGLAAYGWRRRRAA